MWAMRAYINGFGYNNPIREVYTCDDCGAELIYDYNEGRCKVRGGDACCPHYSSEMMDAIEEER